MKNILLFPVYILGRILRTPLWWVPISPFKRWTKNKEFITHDLYLISFVLIGSLFYFWLGLIWAIFALVVILTSVFVYKIQM